MNICPICNKKAGIGARGRIRIFCSKSCAAKYRQRNRPKKGTFRKCKFCEKDIYCWPCSEKFGLGYFCGKYCKSKYYYKTGTYKKNLCSPGKPFIKNKKRIHNPYKRIWVNGHQTTEHRWLMERHIGRKLKTCEHIHHVNGNPVDNRIENLKILSRSEHAKLEYAQGTYKR